MVPQHSNLGALLSGCISLINKSTIITVSRFIIYLPIPAIRNYVMLSRPYTNSVIDSTLQMTPGKKQVHTAFEGKGWGSVTSALLNTEAILHRPLGSERGSDLL